MMERTAQSRMDWTSGPAIALELLVDWRVAYILMGIAGLFNFVLRIIQADRVTADVLPSNYERNDKGVRTIIDDDRSGRWFWEGGFERVV